MSDSDGILIWEPGKGPGGLESPILVRNARDPLKGKTPEQFESALRELLQGRVLAAWLFGSLGTPAFGPDSDVDLILVLNTEVPFFDRIRDFFDVMDLAATMDLLIYTPAEFAAFTKEPQQGFWTSVVATMRRIV